MKLLENINRFKQSMVGYLPIKILEGIIGIITLNVYTRLFIPDIYGQFTIINQTIIIIFLISLSWMVQSVTRFTETYSKNKEHLYSTLFITWFVLVISISVIFLTINNLFSLLDNIRFAFLIVVFFATYSLNQIILVLLYYSYKKITNSILLLCSALGKLLLTIILVKVYGGELIIIFLSHSIVDGIVALIGVHISNVLRYIRIKNYSKKLLKSIIKYGYPLIGLTLTMFILNASDRYFIKYFYDNRHVGIYATNYSISSSVFSMLMLGLSRGIYIKILNAWNNKNVEETVYKVSSGAKLYIFIGAPSAVGLALLSKPISKFLLDIQYAGGYPIIGIVAVGMFFLGLAEYYNKSWELMLNTIPILTNSIIAAVINIILNIIFVPKAGYIAAAYTTLASFYIYLLISIVRSNKELRVVIKKKFILNIALSIIVMALVVFIMRPLIELNILLLLLVILIGALIYFGIFYITGELKNLFQEIKE